MSERKKQIFLEAIKKAKKESVMGKLANGDTDPMEPWSKKHAPLDEVNTQVLWKYIKAMGRDPRTIPLADRLNLARTDKFKKFSRDHAKFTDIGESNEDSITEMDSQGYKGHRGDEDPGKGPEKVVKPAKTKDVKKDAERTLTKALDQAHKKKGVAEGATCNKTMEGESCPVHGLKECPSYRARALAEWKRSQRRLKETTAGSVAGVVNPGGKPKSKVGSLFGGTYKQPTKKKA